MQKAIQVAETFLFAFLTVLLFLLFVLNLPLFREPHGFLIANELSDFSSTELIGGILFGSVAVCAVLGVVMVKWLPVFTAGMASNLWATTFFLLWVDSMFSLSIQFQSFRFLVFLALGLLFLYLFFFTMHYLDLKKETAPKAKEASVFNDKLVQCWLGGWMFFYLVVSIRLLFNSLGYLEFQIPLALGFCALCFLYYLLFLFLRKSRGEEIQPLSRVGRIVFASWILGVVIVGVVHKWPH